MTDQQKFKFPKIEVDPTLKSGEWHLMQDKNSTVHKIISAHANQVAIGYIMRWLDSKGVSHCRYCPTTGPLRRRGNDYICNPHYGLFGNEKDLEDIPMVEK